MFVMETQLDLCNITFSLKISGDEKAVMTGPIHPTSSVLIEEISNNSYWFHTFWKKKTV